MLATLALALAVQAATPAEAVPMTVAVRTAPGADAAVREWAKELSTALTARRDEFRVVKPGEKAELLVRLDSVGKGPDGTPSLKGAFVLGPATRPFTYGFTDVRAEAGKLARNLRKLADQMKAAGK
jgi:hypothetical protein